MVAIWVHNLLSHAIVSTHFEAWYADMTIADPVAFTKPWHVVRRYRRIPSDTFVSDVICLETQHSPIVDGQTQFILPGDPPGHVLGPMPVKPKN
jgi:hypothetical protein